MTELEQAVAKLRNKDWRMSHLYKIKTKGKQLITYQRNLAQHNYALRKALRNIILKARQLGFSTEGLIDLLDDTITVPNTNSAIVAHDQRKVIGLFEIVKRAYQNMPETIRPVASFDNRNELYFPELDSKIYVTLDTRSETVHNLHWSEVAFTKDAENKAAAIYASVPKDGKITLESTANGMAGYFFNEWEDPRSEFKKNFYNWLWEVDYSIPLERSLDEMHAEYRELSIRYGLMLDIFERFNLSPEQFAFYIKQARRYKELVVQEFPTTALEAFLASGRNVFKQIDLQKHQTMFPIDRKWADVLIWETPLKGFKYVIGVDPAEGVGGDSAAVEVFNAQTGEQVAEFASSSISPDRLAYMVIELGNWYNKALLVVESNNHGHAVLQILGRKYYNLYRRKTIDKISGQETDRLGWNSNGTTKPLLVDNLEEAVRMQSISLRSEELVKEMKVFVQTDVPGKMGYGAEGSAHDDRVIAAGLAVQGIRMMPMLKKYETLAEKKLREYAEKHGLPSSFTEEENIMFPPDQARPSDILTGRNRPKGMIRR